jgi:hypothetical protein
LIPENSIIIEDHSQEESLSPGEKKSFGGRHHIGSNQTFIQISNAAATATATASAG